MKDQAQQLLELGAKAVLLKGGHADGAESVDFLVQPTSVARLAVDRIPTVNTHGTGCTLSSAVAAGLAGSVARGSGARGEGLCHGRHRRVEPASYRSWFWPDAPFPRVVVISFRDRSQGMRRKVASHSSGSTTFG